jgi:hypothetical protein
VAQHLVYKFYAELDDYKPNIWRRFEVTGNKTMAELGYILMTLFEMQASHLFCFTFDFGTGVMDKLRESYSYEDISRVLDDSYLAAIQKRWRFELPFEEIFESENEKSFDARRYRLSDISKTKPLQFTFEYDFGDSWRVSLTLESCEKLEIHASELPRALEGAGFGIIEDCGGVHGLYELAQAFTKKKGSEYDEYREWLGVDELDLDAFNLDDMNFRLKKLPRIFRESYEYGYTPTQRSIDLIERKYMK